MAKASRPSVPGRRRAYALAAILLLIGLGYVASLSSMNRVTTNSEQHFGADKDTQQLGIYAVVLSIDPVNEALHLRLYVTPSNALRGERPTTPSRDLTLRIDDGHAVQEVAFHANQPMLPVTVEITLEGNTVAMYPFERLHAPLRISVQDGFQPAIRGVPERLVSVRLTFWEGVAGWAIHTAGEPGDGGQVRLRLRIQRIGALAFLALALYAMMVVIAVAALTIGSFIVLEIRKVEATLASSLSGMLFALPAMRYALPGSPPLGVLADQWVFLWAELAVALGLFLFVLGWVLHGPRPS